jgi:hypothetical protein
MIFANGHPMWYYYLHLDSPKVLIGFAIGIFIVGLLIGMVIGTKRD